MTPRFLSSPLSKPRSRIFKNKTPRLFKTGAFKYQAINAYKYDCNKLAFEFCLKRISALSFIWRTRSRVRLYFSPISSKECGALLFKPKNNTITCLSRSAKMFSERFISWLKRICHQFAVCRRRRRTLQNIKQRIFFAGDERCIHRYLAT
jgi:hypothetical protein